MLMVGFSFQFQGVGSEQSALLLALLAGIGLVLIGLGLWLLARRRWRLAAACLALVVLASAAAGALLSMGISAGGAWMVLLAVVISAAIGVVYGSVYSRLGPARLTVLMALRSAAIVALMGILFKPVLAFRPDAAQAKPPLAILVDRSASMATIDEPNMPDRYSQAIAMLTMQQDRLSRGLRPVWHHFGRSLETASSLAELGEMSPAGQGAGETNIALAIRSAVAASDRSALAGLLIITDGIDSGQDDPLAAAGEAGVPIYAAAVGSRSETLTGRRNIELLAADCPLTAVRNNVATVTCRVKLTGLAMVPVELRLTEAGSDQPLDTARLWTDKDADTLTATLKWTPREATAPPGAADVRRLTVTAVPNPAEAVTDDNAAQLHVLVTDPEIRVLYIAGSIRPEFKFLRRLLDSDPNVQLMALVRIADNRFLAQGSVAGKKLDSLPATAEQFGLFDVIIIGDLDSRFLTGGQMSLLKQFVDDGGAMVMLGGHNAFGPGGYGGTDVAELLPVIIGPRPGTQEATPLLPQLTAAGQGHPIFEGIGGYFLGPGGSRADPDKVKLPALSGCVAVLGAKPAAEVLALHPTRSNDAGPLIVLAVQRFGAGRSAAFTADTTWRWFLPLRRLGAEGPYQRFWLQLVRWLAGVDTATRKAAPSVVMRLDSQYVRLGQSVRITAVVRDQDGRTPEAANVCAEIAPSDGQGRSETISLTYQPNSGLFAAEFTPQRAGKLAVTVSAEATPGQQIGEDAIPLTVAPRSTETERLARNDELLQQLAESTGGRFVRISALPDLCDLIIQRGKAIGGPEPEVTITRLYNFPALLVAFVGLMTAEWILRRRWQLH